MQSSEPFGQKRVVFKSKITFAYIGSLILLLVITILAVSGVVTSTLQLRMVSNQQQQENSFQAADSAIEIALASEPYSTTVPQSASGTLPNGDEYDYELRFVGDSSLPTVPTGYSLGAGFQAYHFVVDGTATSTGGATSEHTQGFYVVGPGG